MIRYIRPVRRPAPGSNVAAIYAQMKREFGILGEPLVLHSPLPDLLAGVWCSFREAILAGSKPRRVKEAVAVAVSRLNRCPYCVDAHSIMLRAASSPAAAAAIQNGETGRIVDPEIRAVVEWASAAGRPGSGTSNPPFGLEGAPEIIGTAVWIHYINRIVSVLLNERLLWFRSDPAGLRTLSERMGGWVFAPLVRRPLLPGASLEFIPRLPLPADMGWAAGSFPIASAFAAFAASVEIHGARVLSPAARSYVTSAVAAWDAGDPGLIPPCLKEPAGVPEEDWAAVRLAVMIAIMPYRVGDAEVTQFRAGRPSQEELLGLLAWASFAAARRVGRLLTGNRSG
jgi:AhpD family alkylhydroperoxidase